MDSKLMTDFMFALLQTENGVQLLAIAGAKKELANRVEVLNRRLHDLALTYGGDGVTLNYEGARASPKGQQVLADMSDLMQRDRQLMGCFERMMAGVKSVETGNPKEIQSGMSFWERG